MIGQRLVQFGESMVARIPVVKTIYNSVKQVSDTLFSSSGQAFRKALLVRFPHGDAWTIAFLTGTPRGEVAAKLGERSHQRLRSDDPQSDFRLLSDRAARST